MCRAGFLAWLAAWLLSVGNETVLAAELEGAGAYPALATAGSLERLPPVNNVTRTPPPALPQEPRPPYQPEFLALRATDAAAPASDSNATSAAPEDPFLFPFLNTLVNEDARDTGADPISAQAERLARRAKADIGDPGPDTVNFPNGPYTLPKGRMYLENSPLGYYLGPQGESNTYQWEFLIRYGLTDNLEFRIFSNGLTIESEPTPARGFSPLAFDLKLHLWEQNKQYWLPAVGIEVYIQTGFGSSAFDSGTQPALSLLFDQTLPGEIEFNYAFSMTGLRDDIEEVVYQFGFQWAFQRALSDDVDVFVQGFYNDSAVPRVPVGDELEPGVSIPNVNVVGAGLLWTVNDRLAVWGSGNAGTTEEAPPLIGLAGFALAF